MWWLLACTPGTDATDGAPTDEGSGVTVTCAATDNALRLACTAALPTPAATTWTATAADGTVEGVWSVAEDASPAPILWGLPPGTGLTVTVVSDAGDEGAVDVATGALPAALEGLSVGVTGAPTEVEGVLVTEQCGGSSWLLVLDGAGRVVWYHEVEGGISGYRWTTASTVLWADGTTVTELSADGATSWQATSTDPLHHDLTRGGDRVYALYAATFGDYVVDGLHVYEGGELVADWWLPDHLTPTGDGVGSSFWQGRFPGAIDWSHGNSVWSDGETALVSLRWQDAVVRFPADPGAADFGAVDWVLTGTDDTDLAGDFDWPDGGGFDGQHHVTPTDGGVTVFDNGDRTAISRGVEVALDEATSTAREVRSWSAGRHCETQGGVERVGDEVLVTCAPAKVVQAFGVDDDAAHFSLTTACSGTAPPGGGWSRAMAVDLPRP